VNSNAISTGARAVVLVIVLSVAAVSGLIVGNAVQGRLGAADTSAQLGGMVPANRGGTPTAGPDLGNFVPANQGGTARATRLDGSADYGVRHMATTPASDLDESADYGTRHPTQAAPPKAIKATTPTPR
jgi:hypothetical protein